MLSYLWGLLLSTAILVYGASLQSVSGWGSNPSGIQMSIYVPDKLASKPPILIAASNGQQMYSSSNFKTYADQYGFIVIYPSSSTAQGIACWDNHSPQSLTRNGGGDTQGLVQQVQYALNKYNGDSSRVYVMGFSSGAMMTDNLAATYPDVFEAGALFSGVPACCWAGAGGSNPANTNTSCANGQIIHTPQDWGNFARNTIPGGYSGRRTRLQIWHGSGDTLVLPANFQEELKQWSNVLSLSLSATVNNNPENGYTEYQYGDGKQLVGYLAAGLNHGGIPYHETLVLSFFGLLGGPATSTTSTTTKTITPVITTGGPKTTTTTTKTTTTTSKTTTPMVTTPPTGGTQTKWGQCGGIGWTGATACSGSTCSTLNPYYAQCL
ncbi:hypothetical protein TWF694_004566 [Orbilia ellipsospora]|uniref:CBM1 domain-containing protein n=1 Tax=Orbilia ellipsospora TaxID=2528407 RepID=A0AAV9WWP0_9PEZI